MKIVGVVAEYNPFHWGHLYHLKRIKSDLNPEAIVCVMSGNFVQRGEPAIFDKWARAEMALSQGADLVFELPVSFSTSTAEIFAHSAVHLLHQTGVVNYLSFGIEENCIDILIPLAEILAQEPMELKNLIKTHLDKGVTFAVARERAILDFLASREGGDDINRFTRLLKKPNFILALEYQKAIHRLEADIKIHPVLRRGAQYHDVNLQGKFPSATAVRAALKKNLKIHSISNSIPKTTLDIMAREIELQRGPVFLKHFEQLILYALRRLAPEDMLRYFDIGEGLEHRIKRASREVTLEGLIQKIKTKRYPEAKIRRILMHILLDIPGYLVSSRKPLYFRVLGFTHRGAQILRKIKERVSTPIITRASDYKKLSPDAKKMFERDLFSSQIYSMAYQNFRDLSKVDEFNRKVIYISSNK